MKFLKIRSRHPSHNVLRQNRAADTVGIPTNNLNVVLRLGSQTTEGLAGYHEINKPQAIKNSSNKKLMKECFWADDVKTAEWWVVYNEGGQHLANTKGFIGEAPPDAIPLNQLPYPIVAKHIFGSRGNGNTLIKTEEELRQWVRGKNMNNYIFEKFYNYNREYRLHVTKDGCFYTCRKMLKQDAPEGQRWFRNDSNSVWIIEENPMFERPLNWSEIEEHCVKALKAVGLDIGGCDVRVQSAMRGEQVRQNPEFIVIEINSACGLATVGEVKYREQLTKMINGLLHALPVPQ